MCLEHSIYLEAIYFDYQENVVTRINVVPISELTDNFILAEYFELPRLYPLIRKAIQKNDRDLPDTYRLGSGHMRFFYNKLAYLYRRHRQLRDEGVRRGLQLRVDPDVNPSFLDPLVFVHDDAFWWQNYMPTQEAIQLNRDRLQIRRKYDGGTYEA